MCGLFGYTINPDMVEKIDLHTMTAMLAYFAERRGGDSWGVVKLDAPGAAPEIIKEIGSIHKTCRIPKILGTTVMGHTRAATVGAVSKRNAHPFHVGDIIGSHNGHVSNWSELNNQYSRKCQVDSEHIFHQISENLPLEKLSGSGTITFLDLKKPNKVFFGRGQYSDLEIFSLGPTDSPWGTLWTSINMWGEDALEMAGITEFDTWNTHLNSAYELDNNFLYELGTFELKNNYTPYTPNCNHRNYSGQVNVPRFWDAASNDWVQSKSMEEYWMRSRANQVAAGIIPADDVEHLPPSLKKNTQISVLEAGQDQKTIETSVQCNGCDSWGALVEDYADQADGVVEHASIDQRLCYQCSSFWGQQTGLPNTKRELSVPELSLNMEY